MKALKSLKHLLTLAPVCAGLTLFSLTGCERETPAEEAGEEVEEAVEETGDAVEEATD